MTTTIPSAALMPAGPVFTNAERLALAGFLAAYSGLTREAYALDLRQFASWCHQHHVHLFGVRRADIECFARDLEGRGRARATVTRRLCTIAGLYRYAVEERLEHSPAAHVRRPARCPVPPLPATPPSRGIPGGLGRRRHLKQPPGLLRKRGEPFPPELLPGSGGRIAADKQPGVT